MSHIHWGLTIYGTPADLAKVKNNTTGLIKSHPHELVVENEGWCWVHFETLHWGNKSKWEMDWHEFEEISAKYPTLLFSVCAGGIDCDGEKIAKFLNGKRIEGRYEPHEGEICFYIAPDVDPILNKFLETILHCKPEEN